ncbi:hypothetical protein ABK040_010116 [Willaertia magna]
MGMCMTKPTGSNQAINEIEKGRTQQDREIKVLLLGAGESGKSTIFKQMKIINLNGYTEEERESYKEIIYGNILKAMKVLVQATFSFNIPIEYEENRERAGRINELEQEALLHVHKYWTPEIAEDIQQLWNDPGIQKVYEKRNEFQIDDSAPYYFNNLDRIKAPDYKPSEQDVIRSRVKTTGIVEMSFRLGDQTVTLIDVGGQRNERKKWIHCFEGVTAIIFVTSLSEYDQRCYEDDSTNRMHESLLLFDEICNSRWFMDTSIILFLNKIDLFKEKISKTDLSQFFVEYEGGKNFEAAVNFIRSKFEEKNRNPRHKTIYSHYTCATDTQQLKQVFDAIKDIILNKTLKEQGLF